MTSLEFQTWITLIRKKRKVICISNEYNDSAPVGTRQPGHEKASETRLFFLKPVDVAKDQYGVFCTDIPREQIIFSPTDEVKNGEHTDDFAIIPVRKPAAFDIEPTEYFHR